MIAQFMAVDRRSTPFGPAPRGAGRQKIDVERRGQAVLIEQGKRNVQMRIMRVVKGQGDINCRHSDPSARKLNGSSGPVEFSVDEKHISGSVSPGVRII